MAGKRKARKLVVTESRKLTKNMQRVTLHGDDLASFPADAEGAYFKFVFPGSDSEKPTLRTYTVANYRPELHEIDVDFMLHANSDGLTDGVAAPWAMQAKPGSSISIFGPGPASFINTSADWFLMAADMSALPALVANLTRLPADANGYVVIEIIAEEDKQLLSVPDGMKVVWVVNPKPGSDDVPLYRAIAEHKWLAGQVSVWVACEFKTMKNIRKYLKQNRKVAKSHLYISSYWKNGLKEEEHKAVKREDANGRGCGLLGFLKKRIGKH